MCRFAYVGLQSVLWRASHRDVMLVRRCYRRSRAPSFPRVASPCCQNFMPGSRNIIGDSAPKRSMRLFEGRLHRDLAPVCGPEDEVFRLV